MYERRSSAVALASLALVALASCSSASGGSSDSPMPEKVLPEYSVSIELGATEALLSGIFIGAPGAVPDAPTASSSSGPGTAVVELGLANGESLLVNGMPTREDPSGYGGYQANVPRVAPGQLYTFTLSVPGKGSYDTSIPMVAGAKFAGLATGGTLNPDAPLTIAWTASEADTSDDIDIALLPSTGSDGMGAYHTLHAAPGSTSVTLGSADLMALYSTAAGSAGGMVGGTVTLTRKREHSLSAPFAGGSVTLECALDGVTVAVNRVVP